VKFEKMAQTVKRIKRTKTQAQKQLDTSLFDVEHRVQLDTFVCRLFKHVEADLGVRFQDLLASYKTLMGGNVVESDGDSEDNKEMLELEYVMIDGGEYLYDANTKAVYSYSNPSSKRIGYFDTDTESIKLI
jgi:hypothetical protein